MAFLDDCDEHFGTRDLYEVLHAKKGDSPANLKKAYYRQSMKHHPDKAMDSEEAKQKATICFQIVVRTYNILSDTDRRKLYDQQGVVEDDDSVESSLMESWRSMFKKVTIEDIENFHNEYKGSDDERKDVKKAYERSDGDMSKIMDEVLFVRIEDEPRIKEIIDEMISEGNLTKTAKYKKTTSTAAVEKRKKKASKEAAEAEQMLKEITAKEGTSDLQSLILKRNAARGEGFLDALAEKYAPKKKSKK